MSKQSSYEMNMTEGPILTKLLRYAVPLMLSGILQLLFNAVDIIVVGRFAGKLALAAVGTTTALINMFVNLFIGISAGVCVCAAQAFAVRDDDRMSRITHTAIMSGLTFGTLVMIIGVVFGRNMLELMDVPENVIDDASLYLRIYFCGMIFLMIYNFGSAILKAIGDTRRPLIFLTIAGFMNAILNVILVKYFSLGVAGVAIATAFSQFISSVLVVLTLLKASGSYKLILSRIRFHKDVLVNILSVGLPAGFQTMLISFSNVLIQSSINSFGAVTMAAFTSINSLVGFCYTAVNSITQTAMSFISQNYSVSRFKRIKRICWICLGMTLIFGSVMGTLFTVFGHTFIGIYSTDPEVIECAVTYMGIILVPYGLAGTMDLGPGCMRGMNESLIPMILHITGVVLVRIVWIFFVFPSHHAIDWLFASYPMTWIISTTMEMTALVLIYKKKSTRAL